MLREKLSGGKFKDLFHNKDKEMEQAHSSRKGISIPYGQKP